jgi:hypothetical protein
MVKQTAVHSHEDVCNSTSASVSNNKAWTNIRIQFVAYKLRSLIKAQLPVYVFAAIFSVLLLCRKTNISCIA